MKLEDLKNCEIITGEGVDIFIMNEDDIVSTLFYETAYDFDDAQTALLAAARFRASEVMYQAIKNSLKAWEEMSSKTVEYMESRNIKAEYAEPEWVTTFRAALALADNTNETL